MWESAFSTHCILCSTLIFLTFDSEWVGWVGLCGLAFPLGSAFMDFS